MIDLVVNIKSAKGFFFLLTILDLRIVILMMTIIFKMKCTSFSNQFVDDIAQIQMFKFSYVDSSTIQAIKKIKLKGHKKYVK